MTAKPPFWNYEQVRDEAEKFLKQNHPDRTLPIPIEQIVEYNLGLDIVPMWNLYRDHGRNGFLTSDCTAIWIDEEQADSWPEKYRFTLAHEVGHLVLHADYLAGIHYSSIGEYKSWIDSESTEVVGWLETHANWFAGLALVPGAELQTICRQTLEKYSAVFEDMDVAPDDTWSYVSNEVAGHFDVNAPVVEIRIQKDRIAERMDLPDSLKN